MEPSLRPQAKEFLLGIPVFGGLPDETMERLLSMIQMRGHRIDDVICEEGKPGSEMFIVRAGEVEVRKRQRDRDRETMLAKLKAGDCFGEMSLIDIQPRSASVYARQPTELYVLDNRNLYALYEADLPGYTFLMQNLCRELSRRLRRADQAIAEFFQRLEDYVYLAVD
jgi:CRP-like cAMP-binding protein